MRSFPTEPAVVARASPVKTVRKQIPFGTKHCRANYVPSSTLDPHFAALSCYFAAIFWTSSTLRGRFGPQSQLQPSSRRATSPDPR
jgi:hypothetical protein